MQQSTFSTTKPEPKPNTNTNPKTSSSDSEYAESSTDVDRTLVFRMLELFAQEEKWNIIGLFVVSTVASIVQTNGVGFVTSNLINAIQKNESSTIFLFYQYLVAILILGLVLYRVFHYFQHKVLTKMRPWARHKMLEFLLKVNSDSFSEINFTRLNSPIHRVADLICSILSDVISFVLPNLLYLFVTTIYFLYLNPMFGIIFLIGNIVLFSYYFSQYESMLSGNMNYESQVHKTDSYMIDILNNVDKIVYRGQMPRETESFGKASEENHKAGFEYYNKQSTNVSIMLFIVLTIVLISILYMIHLFSQGKISTVSFISSFTILLLFREKMGTLAEQLPDFIGYIGRMNAQLHHFKHVSEHLHEVMDEGRFKGQRKLAFKQIVFDNVTYKYGQGKMVFDNRSYTVNTTDHKIIGITGPSGSGKSTFVKLLIKMYQPASGKIMIDGKDIQEMDPLYLRNEITYVNQNSKLFDKKVIDNMLYGCNDPKKCKYFLDKIMKYPHISKLYKNMDIKTKQAGLLGENLSGGQRQIVNMIGGFINPSKLLILDEPTNALDPALKHEVIGLIEDFKIYKQAILIITHDKDVFSLFDDELKM
jgi:ABC-type multidrug transport system fused ATPase/permease subunit